MRKILYIIISLFLCCSCVQDIDEKTMIIKAMYDSPSYNLSKYHVHIIESNGSYNGQKITFTAPKGLYHIGDTLTFAKLQ